jgi:hypothetical protein
MPARPEPRAPREERQDRARLAEGIAEIEVIGTGIVEIDGLLHEAKAQDTRVEVQVAAGGARDGGDVVDAVVPHGMRP